MRFLKEDAQNLVHSEFGMDPYFPDDGAQCGKQHVEYMLQVVWPMLSTFGRVIVAQRQMVTYTTVGLFAVGDTDLDHLGAGHVFLMDKPGKGKTLFGKIPAKLIKASFARIQCTADMLPADYTGSRIIEIDKETDERKFVLHKGPAFADIQLFDEINRSTPRTQSGMLEALGEGTITIPGEPTYQVSPFAIFTANPVESEGTSQMSDAMLDRIMFQVRGENFDSEDFKEILKRVQEFDDMEISPVCDKEKIAEIRRFFSKSVHVSGEVYDRIARFAEMTNDPHAHGHLLDLEKEFDDSIIQAAVSGRSEIHLLGAARTMAAFRYRNFVTVDDVRKILLPALRHRFIFRSGFLRSMRSKHKHDTTLETRDWVIQRLINEGWG